MVVVVGEALIGREVGREVMHALHSSSDLSSKLSIFFPTW